MAYIIGAQREKAQGQNGKDRTMIENVEVAYCMAKLEEAIRWEKRTADIYLEIHDGEEDQTYKRMVAYWSSMITAFEIAFGVSYFKQY